jgi:hypothetical protein
MLKINPINRLRTKKKRGNSIKEYKLYIFQLPYTGNVLVKVLEVANPEIRQPNPRVADNRL